MYRPAKKQIYQVKARPCDENLTLFPVLSQRISLQSLPYPFLSLLYPGEEGRGRGEEGRGEREEWRVKEGKGGVSLASRLDIAYIFIKIFFDIICMSTIQPDS